MSAQIAGFDRRHAVRSFLTRALELGAFRLSPQHPIRWASGNLMPLYTDNRQILRDVTGRRYAGEVLRATLAEWSAEAATVPFDLVAGTASAGIVPATLVAEALELDLAYVRPAPKDHGLGRQVEGLREDERLEGRSVLLIEDLVSTGGSAARAAAVLTRLGATVPVCLALFSYCLPAVGDTFNRLAPGCALVPAVTIDDLIAVAREEGVLDGAGLELLHSWREDPIEWQYRYGWATREEVQ